MIAFVRRVFGQEPVVEREDARQKRIEENERRLRAWGFGPLRTAGACRERLKRLVQFLFDLEREEGSRGPEKSEIRKLKKAFEKKKSLEASRHDHIRRLKDLRRALSDLVQRKETPAHGDSPERKEDAEAYFERLKEWNPELTLNFKPEDSDKDRRKRRDALEKSLTTLRILSADRGQPADRPIDCFESLLADLQTFESGGQDEVRGRLKECFEDCVGDWEWAYLQILIRLAVLLLEEEPGCLETLEQTAGLLEEAIEKLEDKELLQARWQGLYGTLAGTYLRRTDLQTDVDERQSSLHKALTYAQHAVEMEPESVRERLKLLEVLSALGDYEEMRAEADIALDLDSSSETLKTVGKCFWGRIASLHDRRERRRVLREALRFFREALTHVESDPFDNEDPLEQVQAHGWAHFWLGRFLCESGDPHEGAIHLRTSRSLGFKPLESRVELAWAHLLERNPEAEQAFRDAIEEAERQSEKGPPRAAGEERLTDDLKLEAYLGWAFLWADRDPERTKQKLAKACEVARALKRESEIHFRAVVHEAHGRIALKEGGLKLKRAVEELEQSIGLRPRSGAFCALASAKLQQARYNEKGRADTLRQAREACRLAHENDLRGRYRRDLADILRQLRQMEKTAAKPA